MNQQIQDDLKLFKKAKRRVNAMLVFSYLLLGLWNAALYFLLTQPLFERPHSFLIFYLTSMLAQMIVWMMIFFALSEGKPKLRLLLILGILAQLGWCGFLGYDLLQNTDFILFYVLWIAMELVQVFYLLWLRGWLKNSWWARIFFDHVVELEGDEEEQILQPTAFQQPLQQPMPNGYGQGYQNVYPQQGNYGVPQGYNPPNYGYPQPNQQPYGQQGYPAADAYGYSQQAWPNEMPQNGYPSQVDEEVYAQQTDQPQPTYVTPASSFAGNPDITPQLEEEYDEEEYPEKPRGKKFPFFSNHKQEVQEAQFVNQGPIDFQADAQVEALRQQEAVRREAHEVSQSYSHIAMRMAAVVYGELVLFPILINLFQNNFVSIDNSSVFAINLMFTLCILSAVVWTIPIFFLYLKQPGVKKILWGAAALQVGVAAFGLWMLHGYYEADTIHYADKVFTYFLMAEVIRYGLLIAGIFPAFQLPSIKDIHYELEEDDFDDSDIVLELVSEEDPESDEDEEQIQSFPSQSQPSTHPQTETTLSEEQPSPAQDASNTISNPTKPSSASFLEIDDITSEGPMSSSQS